MTALLRNRVVASQYNLAQQFYYSGKLFLDKQHRAASLYITRVHIFQVIYNNHNNAMARKDFYDAYNF